MESLKKLVLLPMGIMPAKSYKGPYGQMKKVLMDMNGNCHDPSKFTGLNQKPRDKEKVARSWKNAFWYECEEVDSPHEMADLLVYIFDDTPGSNQNEIPEPKVKEDCIPLLVSQFNIIDDLDPQHHGKNIVFVTPEGKMVAYKLCKRERGTLSLRKWKRHFQAVKLALKTMRNSPRGIRRAGCYFKYVMLGFRRDGNGKEVHEYVPKINAKPEEVAAARDGVRELMKDLERAGLNMVPDFEIIMQNKLREKEGLHKVLVNGKKGRFTAVAISHGYWSPVHVDDDVFRTLLTCYDPSKMNPKDHDDILFYFIFASINVAVPMRSTDILVFDSSYAHCASNYRSRETVIMSCFTSGKTTYAHMSSQRKVSVVATENDVEVVAL